jgi:CRP/FNR family transcriptional regulator, cyclic AMP receptor protein
MVSPAKDVRLRLEEDEPGAGVGLVLDLDPDLGWGLGEQEWNAARQACRGRLLSVQPGVWSFLASAGVRGDCVGFLIVSGLLCREIALCERRMFELLGPGDVLQPPVLTDGPRLGGPTRLTALRETELIELGDSFLPCCARWPVLLTRWARRLEVQRERVAVQCLIAHLPRAQDRLLLVLWHLADRWGRVTPAGTVLPVPFTHDLLGHLAAARRSTVTLAVGALESNGAIRRLDDGSWLLTADAQRIVTEIALPGKHTHDTATPLMLRQRIADASAETCALPSEAEQASQRAGRRRKPPPLRTPPTARRHRSTSSKARRETLASVVELLPPHTASSRRRGQAGDRCDPQAADVIATTGDRVRERGRFAVAWLCAACEQHRDSEERPRDPVEVRWDGGAEHDCLTEQDREQAALKSDAEPRGTADVVSEAPQASAELHAEAAARDDGLPASLERGAIGDAGAGRCRCPGR